MHWKNTYVVVSAALAFVAVGHAQVPPDIEAGLRKIGQIVDPPCTAKLYRPLMPANDINSNVTHLYPRTTLARDVSFGPNPKDLVDIFTADQGGASRSVFIYVPGGAGNKIEQQDREANAFYDNIGRWATKNGMVGVLMQRHPGQNWDDPAKDVSAMIQWLQANIGKYKGNPERMFIAAHSAGNGPLGTYIGRPEVWGPKGVGVDAAIFVSGQWNVAPLEVPLAGGGGAGRGAAANPLAGMGSSCGVDPNSTAGFINGPSRSDPRAPLPPAGAARGGRGGPPDAATQVARSTLPEFKKSPVKMMFITAELDPGINGGMSSFYQTLHDELCKDGPAHCPTMLLAKDESHMSEVFSFDTPDKTVSGPVLAFIKKAK
jgi:hypothetical protein